jgi:hypothetical protein
MKMSQIFEASKQYIARTRQEQSYSMTSGPYRTTYICHAVENLYLRHTINVIQRTQARLYITELLGGHRSLEAWIEKNRPDIKAEAESMPWDTAYEKFQTTRIAWIDNIIADLQAQGN